MTPKRFALLLMDFQVGIAESALAAGTVALAQRAREAASAIGAKIIFCKVGFLGGYPEIADDTLVFAQASKHGLFTGPRSALLKELQPEAGEAVIDKKRFSAFTGSPLDVILRAHDVRELVLTGVSTSGVVLSTLRQAFDLDYKCTVLSDACFDADTSVHELLLSKVFPRQATVISVADWVNKVAG